MKRSFLAPLYRSSARKLVLVAALGYFVDIFDLMLFSIYRQPSLSELGSEASVLINHSVTIMNFQMGGLLLGGVFWGLIADRYGRVKSLFGSIFIYSLMTLLNAFVTSVEQYSFCRFLAGFGLAGEIGAGVTLIVETLPASRRGIGTFIMAGFGLCGAIAAGLSAELLNWRHGYIVGGCLGLLLLFIRMSTLESPLFINLEASSKRNQFKELWRILRVPRHFFKYICCLFLGLPIWYVGGVLILFAPEIAKAVGIVGEVKGSHAVMYSYVGVVLGDVLSGSLSQWMRVRKWPTLIFMIIACLGSVFYLNPSLLDVATPKAYYALMVLTGVGTGYWVLGMTIAAESFGTNVRATVSVSLPNMIRGSVLPISYGVQVLRESMELDKACLWVGAVCFALSFLGYWFLDETWGRDLNYVD